MGEETKRKFCRKCGEEKDLENDFNVNRATKDGRERFCKECAKLKRKGKIRAKAAAGEPPDKKRAYKKRWDKLPVSDIKITTDKATVINGRMLRVIDQLLGIELLNTSGASYMMLLATPENQGPLKVRLLEELKGLVTSKAGDAPAGRA